MTGRSMIARNGIRTTLRARGRTALFTALILLLTLTLALGLGMWAYCSGTLAEMDETYTSVALLEYLGQDYPDGSVADENARQAASALDDAAVAAVDGVALWERNDRALAAMDGYLRSAGEIPYGDQAVLAVFNLIPRYDFAQLSEDQLAASYVATDFDSMSCRIHVSGLLGGDAEVPLYTSSKASEAVEDTYVVVTYFGDTTLVTPEGSIDLWSIPGIASYIHSAASDTYQSEEKVLVGYDAIVSRCLYSLEGREGIAVTMEVGDSGFVGEKGRYYLIHGQFVETGMANRTLVIMDFYDGCETKPYAEISGSDDPLLRDSLFTEYARHCRMANNYISLEASDDIPALEVFQQGYLTLREGRFPAAGEKGVCVADGAMADACGLTVGDTIDLTQMTSADSDRFDLTVTDAVQTLTIVGVTTALKEYQGTVRVPRDGTSVSGQGALRFAMLSARRGGWRSLVVPAAALVLSLFLGLLTATAEGWSRQTDALYESSTLTGQAVSTNGRWNTGLVVPADAARTLWKSGMLSDLSASLGWHYWRADEIPRFAENSFGQERRQAWIASQPQVVALNSLTAAPAYMNSQPPAVTWLDGWDESFLSDRTWQPFYHALRPGTGGLYGDKAQTYPCIVGADYAVQRDLSLGDTCSVWLSWSTMNRTMESAVTLRIVGTVNQTGMAEDIYVPFGFWGDPAWLDGQEDVLAPGERPDFLFTDRVQMEKYFYGTTNYGTCAFTLRSAYDLEPFRQYLAQQGFSQVRAAGANRTTLLLLDQSFTETVSALGRYITFSRILFPALFAMVGLLGFLISWLMVNGRRMEFAIMRGLGASRRRVFASFFLEQALLCLTGCVIGCGGLLFLSGGAVKWLAVLAFLLCYLIGCALSVRAVGRTNLMALLAERE